jgi:hypothetical protein
MSQGWTCVFCAQSIAEDADAASFLFLARRSGEFLVVDHWADDDSLEGHQFFCHSDCFTERMDPTLRRAVFDPNF